MTQSIQADLGQQLLEKTTRIETKLDGQAERFNGLDLRADKQDIRMERIENRVLIIEQNNRTSASYEEGVAKGQERVMSKVLIGWGLVSSMIGAIFVALIPIAIKHFWP